MQKDSVELTDWGSKKECYEREIRSLTSRLDELEALVQINELTKVRAELKEGEPCPGLRFIGASLCRKPSARGCDGKRAPGRCEGRIGGPTEKPKRGR